MIHNRCDMIRYDYYSTVSGSGTGYGLNDLGPECLQSKVVILLYTTSGLLMEVTHLPVQWLQRTLSPREKWPRREAQHSPEKNGWLYIYTPLYAFMASSKKIPRTCPAQEIFLRSIRRTETPINFLAYLQVGLDSI
jgi:hypothetical protein